MYDTSAIDQTSSAATAGVMLILSLFMVALVVFLIAALWKVFVKAGQPGWAAIIPIYNTYIMLKIVGRPAWWLLLFFIPLVNYVVPFIVSIDMAKSFKKTPVFGVVALALFAPVGYAILGFGKPEYAGPSVPPATGASAAPVAGPTPPPAAAV